MITTCWYSSLWIHQTCIVAKSEGTRPHAQMIRCCSKLKSSTVHLLPFLTTSIHYPCTYSQDNDVTSISLIIIRIIWAFIIRTIMTSILPDHLRDGPDNGHGAHSSVPCHSCTEHELQIHASHFMLCLVWGKTSIYETEWYRCLNFLENAAIKKINLVFISSSRDSYPNTIKIVTFAFISFYTSNQTHLVNEC